jgi:integrase
MDIENESIFKADLTERERAFIYLGKYAGLRRGEILALTKSDFDLKACTVSVNKTVVFKKNDGEIKHCPKSDAGFRTIPMPDVLYDFIKSYLKGINGLCLFSMQDGGICTKSSFRKLWDSILRKLNIAAGGVGSIKPISGLTPHILRHDYATNLYYTGVDIKTAQKLLGHNNIKMTLEIYTHLKQDNEDVMSKLNKRYEGQKRVKT